VASGGMSDWPKRREAGEPPAPGPERVAAACWALSDPNRWLLAKVLVRERRVSVQDAVRLTGAKGRSGERSAGRWLQALHHAGLVTQWSAADDLRQRVYRLTPHGEVVVMALMGLE
jgi:hypothetical protein